VLAGSNDVRDGHMRVYASADGGSAWRTTKLPFPRARDVCGTSDPTVAISTTGRQYYGYLGEHCRGTRVLRTSLYVSTRASATKPWHAFAVPVARSRGRVTLIDDRPMIAVDDGPDSPFRGRVYVAWSRFDLDLGSLWRDPDAAEVDFLRVTALISHSDDHGRRWSRPEVLESTGQPLEVRLAIAGDGVVYAAWRSFGSGGVFLARSQRSGGVDFGAPLLVAPAIVRPDQSCHSARAKIPAQPERCVSSNPVVAVDRSSGSRSGRVYVVWGSTSLNASQDVYVAAYDPALHPLLGVGTLHQVDPAEKTAPAPDQFLPAAAVDPSSGRLWACYYESVGNDRRAARFTCTASDDGGNRWAEPRVVASAPSNETTSRANLDNGFGDYEAVAAADGRALAAWTDSTKLKSRGEEIFANWIR
jgi:hypothetical protein